MDPEALVGQLVIADRMCCCLIDQYNPKWSQLKYLLLMPGERDGKNRRIRADLDFRASTFSGPDGTPHKVSIFSVQDLIQNPSRSDDAKPDTHEKLLLAAWTYFGIENFDLAEKCIAASFKTGKTSQKDSRIMDFVSEMFKTKIKSKLTSGDVEVTQEVVRDALSLTAASTDDIIRCLQTAEVLQEQKLITDSIHVSNHTLKLVQIALEKKKRALTEDQKELTIDRQLNKVLKDSNTLHGKLQVAMSRQCHEENDSVMIIEKYSLDLKAKLITEFNAFGVKGFSPVHGIAIGNSAQVAAHFWTAYALIDIKLFGKVTLYVISIFKCMTEEKLSIQDFKNLVYDFMALLKKYTTSVEQNAGDTGEGDELLRSSIESMFQRVLLETGLSELHTAILLSLSAADVLRRHNCLRTLSLQYLQSSLQLLATIISSSSAMDCNPTGSNSELREEGDSNLDDEASFNSFMSGEYEENTHSKDTSGDSGDLKEIIKIKEDCDKSIRSVVTLLMADSFSELSKQTVTNGEGVTDLIRALAVQKFKAADSLSTTGVLEHMAAAEQLLSISEALYTSKEAICPDESNASFRCRQDCLNLVACEYAQKAIDICKKLQNMSSVTEGSAAMVVSAKQNKKINTMLQTVSRHMEKCNKELVCERDIMAVFNDIDSSFICYAMVLPVDYGGMKIYAGVDLTTFKENPSHSVKGTGDEFVVHSRVSVNKLHNTLLINTSKAGSSSSSPPVSYGVEFVDFNTQLEAMLLKEENEKDKSALMLFFSTVISFYMGVKMPWEVYQWSERGRNLVSKFDEELLLTTGAGGEGGRLDPSAVLKEVIRFKVENNAIDEAIQLLELGPPPPPPSQESWELLPPQSSDTDNALSLEDKELVLAQATRYLHDASRLTGACLPDAASAYVNAALDIFVHLQAWEQIRQVVDVEDEIFLLKLQRLAKRRSQRDHPVVVSRIKDLQEMAEKAIRLSRLISQGSKQGQVHCSEAREVPPADVDQYFLKRAAQKWNALEKVCAEAASQHRHSDEEVDFLEAMVLARDQAMRIILDDDEVPLAQLAEQYGRLYFAEVVRQVCDGHKIVHFALKLIKASFDSVAKSLLPEPEMDRDATNRGKSEVDVMRESFILRGGISPRLKPISRSMNVFVSSTFTDTVMEYDVLLALLPELEALAATHQIEFAISTMRWGVTDAAFDDNLTSQLCMQEIRRCAAVTCEGSVCFLSFYNTKLGYRPPPLDIPVDEYQFICEVLSTTNEAADHSALLLIRNWYVLDTNKVPNMYRLQPKSALLTDANEWWTIEPILVGALRKAVDILSSSGAEVKMTPDRRRIYFQSVTEEEIQVGLEQTETSRARAYLFTREITDVETHLGDKAAARYVDLEYGTDKRDAVAHSRVQAVTSSGGLLERLLPPRHVHRTSISWDVATGVDQMGQQVYSDQLSSQMKEMFINNIDSSAVRLAQHPSSPSYHEALQHACIALEHRRDFVGRAAELQIISQYLSNIAASHRKALVVTGDVGVGKSSLMAHAAMSAVSSHVVSKNSFVIMRFCGMTQLSSSLSDVLRSILCQLLRARGGMESSVAETFEQVSQSFLLELEVLATAEAPVILFMDGLDQLQTDMAQTHWLNSLLTQEDLPDHVSIIASTLRDETSNILTEWTTRSIEISGNISLNPFGSEDLSSLLQVTLHNENRDLTAHQREEFMQAVSVDSTPLSFSVAWTAARSWSSSLSKDNTTLSRQGAAGLIEAFLQNLERKYDSPGPSLIGKLTTIISLSKSGASRFELEAQVGHDPALMHVLQKWWKLPTATQMPPGLLPRITSECGSAILHESNANGSNVLRFMNSLFETVVLKRYVPLPEDERAAREAIVAYFSDATCPVALPRRVVVVVDQLIQLRAFDIARAFILEKNVFYNYAVKESQRTWLLGVFRATGGYAGLVDAMRAQLDTVPTDGGSEGKEGDDDGGGDSRSSSTRLSRAVQCTTLATLFLDMELLEEAWCVSCEAVQALEVDIPSECWAEAHDVTTITSHEALQHIVTPATAPVLGPSVVGMPQAWRVAYAEASVAKIRSGSLYYDVLESSPDKFKAVATSVLILSRRVLEIWSDDKASKGYGVALTLAGRMSYKQNCIGPVFIDRAVELLNEAVSVLVDTCGELSVEVGNAVYWLGEAYLEKAIHTMGVFQREPLLIEMSIALSCLFAAERIFKISLGSIHKSVGMVLATLGVAMTRCSQLQLSEKYFRQANKTAEVISGVDSVVTATVLLGLTGVLVLQGKYDQSTLDIFYRVRDIFEKTYGKNYERTLKVQQAIDAVEKEIAKTK